MTSLASLPIGTLRLIQRTFSTGLRATYWLSHGKNCGRSITHVSSLHFLIHFFTPKIAYRRIKVRDLLIACGFHWQINLEDAMRALLCLYRNHRSWNLADAISSPSAPPILPNDSILLDQVPWKFWELCRQILEFRLQRPTNLPVSIRSFYSWNLNSWYPENDSNAHKTWIIRSLLRSAPVLLQETKWTQAQLLHLAHTWPDIRIAAATTKLDPYPQAGVAILLPPGWHIDSQRILVDHYAVAASVSFQACQIWIVSVYIPPNCQQALLNRIFQATLALEEHPVFVGGDFNRCDQYYPQIWDDFLSQAGLMDIDPSLLTYWYTHQHGHTAESSLDRILVPSIFLDTAQLHVQLTGRYRISTCHHKLLRVLLKMKPRLTPHPESVQHLTIPTRVFLDPTAAASVQTEEHRLRALHQLRRRILLASESCPHSTSISIYTRAIIWNWWRTSSQLFKRLTPLKRLYKLLGKNQAVIHVGKEDLCHLYEQSGIAALMHTWPQQHQKSLIPTTLIASALQAAEIASTALSGIPYGQDSTDPARRARQQRLFWDRLKTVCPRGTFYHGPLLQSNGQECRTAQEYDEAMLATRSFWFRPPARYDPSWHQTLDTYRQHTEPWPAIPEPSIEDYVEHLLLTKDSAPGPDGLPYAVWRMIPHHAAMVLQDDFERMIAGTLPAPTQVGVWIPKAKQGPTADFFRPLGMPDTLDRLQDGTAAAILFRTTRHCFHPAQTMLNIFREPQRAVLEVQQALEGSTPASALFADLSKAFERVNAYWILHILQIRQSAPWALQLAKYLLFGRRIRHKVQGRLLPPRAVHSGVDMGRSTSVYFFCLAMDPIFVALHQVPRVLLVAGYVDDTTIVGQLSDPHWIKEVFSLIDSWSTAGVVMDAHTCWQVGFSLEPLAEQQLLRYENVANVFRPWHEPGEATVSRAIQHIPYYAQYFVLRHGEHCVLFRTSQMHGWADRGHPLLLQLAASPCQCRSKTQLLISDALTAAQLYEVDRAGLGNQCIVPTTVNLGLTLHTGWACGLQTEEMEYSPLRRDVPSLLSKQLLKLRTRIAAGVKGNLSIHAKIIYFNAFSLSLFYYVQTHRYFPPHLLTPLYKTLADFLLKRHWFPQRKLVGICRWLRLGPLLDPSIMHAVSLFGCYLRQGHCMLPNYVRDTDDSYRKQVSACWKFWQQQLSTDEVRHLLGTLNRAPCSPRHIKRFLDLFKQFAVGHLIDSSIEHLSVRIFRNGWTYGPSLEFLSWLARIPVSQVGAVPRFAVLRWALGEDADLWLPLRGRVSRTSPCVWCGCNARNYPAGPAKGSLCYTCTGPCPTQAFSLPADVQSFLHANGVGSTEGADPLKHLFPPIADKLHSSSGPLAHAAPIPCVLCQQGANAIDHWLSYCPVVYAAWALLWKSTPPLLDWQSIPAKSAGVALCYLLFHTRRLVTEHGGLRPTIECLRERSVQNHARDLWHRIYHSLPATLLQAFRAPPIQHDLPCTDTRNIKAQRFPRTQVDSALLPEKGLCTMRAFTKNESIATFCMSDVRLRLLSLQYRKLPFPAATATLLPYTCHC